MSDLTNFSNQEQVTTQQQEATPSSVDQNTPASNDNLATLLGRIKNENGEPKYKDAETALNALAHSQEYIPELKGKVLTYEQRIQELENELSKRAAVEDVVSKLSPKEEAAPAQPAPAGLTEEDVNKILEARTKAQTTKANFEAVQNALQKQYGDKVVEVITTKAQELGFTTAELGELAGRSPKAALQLFGSSLPSQTKQTSSLNTTAFQNNPQANELQPRTKSLMNGATSQDMAEELAAIKAHVYKKFNVEN